MLIWKGNIVIKLEITFSETVLTPDGQWTSPFLYVNIDTRSVSGGVVSTNVFRTVCRRTLTHNTVFIYRL